MQAINNNKRSIDLPPKFRRLAARWSTIRIDAALDLGDALLMLQDHLDHFDDTPHDNCRDGNQPNPKIDDRLHHEESTPGS